MAAIDEIAAERKRQIEVEGWTADHDLFHKDKSLALVAALYATPIELLEKIESANSITFRDPWPWWGQPGNDSYCGPTPAWDKRAKHSERRRLVIAAALIVAEIERLDRAAKQKAA